jgi:hypothetical protein
MKQTKIEKGYSAHLLHRINLKFLSIEIPLKAAKALSPAIPLPLLGHTDRVIE